MSPLRSREWGWPSELWQSLVQSFWHVTRCQVVRCCNDLVFRSFECDQLVDNYIFTCWPVSCLFVFTPMLQRNYSNRSDDDIFRVYQDTKKIGIVIWLYVGSNSTFIWFDILIFIFFKSWNELLLLFLELLSSFVIIAYVTYTCVTRKLF